MTEKVKMVKGQEIVDTEEKSEAPEGPRWGHRGFEEYKIAVLGESGVGKTIFFASWFKGSAD